MYRDSYTYNTQGCKHESNYKQESTADTRDELKKQEPKWNSLHSLPQQSVWSLRSLTLSLIYPVRVVAEEWKFVLRQDSPWLRRGIPDFAYGTSAQIPDLAYGTSAANS